MNLPKWVPTMRRQPKDIKVKDFIDDKTKHDLVKMVGKDPDAIKSYTSNGDFLDYLSEARTTAEVQKRFGYKTLASAWGAVYRLMKENKVTQMGHGLYIATNVGVKQFNVADLPEGELQARGYDAFKKHVEEEKREEAKVAPVPLRKSHKHGGHSNAGWGKRYDLIVDFLGDESKTSREVAEEFNYKSPMGARWALVRLEAKGRIMSLNTGKGPTKWAKYKREEAPVVAETETETIGHAQEEVAEVTTIANEDIQGLKLDEKQPLVNMPEEIENLAMKYSWEIDLNAAEKAVLRKFIGWVREDK